ncbi:MAG: hypothetical protein AAF664_05820 [Planctomycetota bacterium]
MSDKGTLRCTLFLLMSGLVWGCEPEPTPRLPISGLVKVEGVDIQSGTIRFEPLGGSGPSASTALVANRFSFSAADGPQSGSYRVVVQQTPQVEETPKSKGELARRQEPLLFDESLEQNLVWILRSIEVRKDQLSLEIVIDPEQ